MEGLKMLKVVEPEVETIEPYPVDDVFVNTLPRVDNLGSGLARFVLGENAGQPFRCLIVKAKILVPQEYASMINKQIARALAQL
jgi:hypothetical protein